MVPHQIANSGICSTCKSVANEQQILECYDCKTKYHVDCDNTAAFCTKSFLKSFEGMKVNNNFIFVCDHCITSRENKEASTLKDQMAEVVASVALLAKEVSAQKNEKEVPVQSARAIVDDYPEKVKNLAGSDPNHMKIKSIKEQIIIKHLKN